MSVFSGPALKERVYPLLETGEYVVTLSDLTFEAGGTYGDSLCWKWLLALPVDPTGYIARDDGNEKIHHEYTSPDVIVGSKAHEWIASLVGKTLAEGDDPPDSDDLLGQRMLVYLTHQAPKQGPNVGKLRERFVQGSSKPFSLVPPKKIVNPTRSRPAPVDDDDDDRALIVSQITKRVARLTKLDADAGAVAKASVAESDLDTASLEDLQALSDQIQDAVARALDA